MTMANETKAENIPLTEGGKPKLSFEERRRDLRQVMLMKGMMRVLDGANAGSEAEISTRNLSCSGLCFLIKEELRVGQTCEIRLGNGSCKTYEVVRSRVLSSGKWEIAVTRRN
jgi:hypothetical protein